jgi:hypothetical protein
VLPPSTSDGSCDTSVIGLPVTGDSTGVLESAVSALVNGKNVRGGCTDSCGFQSPSAPHVYLDIDWQH